MMDPLPISLLLVDDRPDNLLVLQAILRDAWPTVRLHMADGAPAGLLAAKMQAFDGAIVDVQMPEMGGIEMCRRLKAEPATSDLPVILITSHETTPQLRAEGLLAGADDFISRPIDQSELTARIRVMIRLRRAERALRTSNERLEKRVQEKTRQLRASRDELRSLFGHAIDAREEERLAIAREIHDDLGQQLTAAIFELGALQADASGDLLAGLMQLEATLQAGLDAVRRVCRGLRPEILETLGLPGALAALAADFQRRYGLRCRIELPESIPRFPAATELSLFRIVQECLSNVARHARADSVTIRLAVEPGSLALKVVDDGRGFGEETLLKTTGYGIKGMRERVSALSGSLEWVQLDPGTCVAIRIPCGQDQGGRS